MLITTEDLESIDTVTMDDGSYGIEIVLTDDGAEKFRTATEENIGNALDVYVNGVCVSSPTVHSVIVDGKVNITGLDTLLAAYEIVSAVKNGGEIEGYSEETEETEETEEESEQTEEPVSTETATEEPQEETGTEIDKEESGEGIKTRNIGELTFNDEPITDVTIRDMKEYDYIKDVYIEVDESNKQINITVQVPSSTDEDTAKMAGEDTARYLAACASWVNSYYSSPGVDDIGGIYDRYDLLIYIDDGNGTFNIYGAKVTSANKITWR